jgi:hypothetical protein
MRHPSTHSMGLSLERFAPAFAQRFGDLKAAAGLSRAALEAFAQMGRHPPANQAGVALA